MSVRLSARPSVRPRGTTRLPSGRNFMKFDISLFLQKSVEKIKVLLKFRHLGVIFVFEFD